MLHSGSRNIGKKISDYYIKLAKELNIKWFSVVNPKHDLAFLPLDTDEAKLYIKDLNFSLDFAYLNRKLMMDNIKKIMNDLTGCDFEEMINIHHNYAQLEHHFGKNVMVHRKGATSARLGEIGLIPGSQGTSSYIVEGLGNPESFTSCSHGAGRKMGRKYAQKNLDLKNEIKKLNDQGIVHSIRNVTDLDEASGAYKNIDKVMKEQEDLVKILVKLSPLGVIKG